MQSNVRPEITLILPAYNEAKSIRVTVQEAMDYFRSIGYTYEIIVAADGTDGTREIIGEMAQDNPALRVIGYPERRGKGRGIREAVAIATGKIVGYADADNKVPIQELSKLLPLFSEGYDVAIGSRALKSSVIERRQPLYRRLGSMGFYLLLKSVISLPGITDTQCGFKFFSARAALEIFRCQKIDGYMFDVEILLLVQKLGYRYKQIPIRWRDDGDSRLDLISGNLCNVRDLFRIRFIHAGQREPAPFPVVPADASDGGS